MKFFDAEKGQFDVESYRHAIRLWTVVLEISVLMAQFPSPEIARKSYQYRTLGLGYANLGTLLMVSGIPYDSPRALAISGALSAILTGESYATSADMASQVGPFPKYQENADHMLRVMRNHRRAAYNAPASEYEEVSVVPMGIDQSLCPPYLLAAARDSWDRALELGEKHGYRNAQATCIAPTGCLVGGSLVITERGLMRLQRLGNTSGDKWQDVSFDVLTDQGERQATKFYVNGVENTRRIKTENGYSIQGTPAHRIKVVNPTTAQLEWKRFADVQPGDITALSMGRQAGSPNVVSLPPLGEEYWTGDYTTRVPRQMSESLAELVGYFMGDGSLHSKGLRFCVAAQDADVVRWLTETIKELFNIDAILTQKTGYTEVAAHSVPLTIWWEA
jgi:ribonucleoside-diphosphate reductase alpha chain